MVSAGGRCSSIVLCYKARGAAAPSILAGVTERAAKRAAGLAVVHDPAGARQYLVLRAFRNWDLPKGRLEAGETPFDAAMRETREETGIAELEFRWGKRYLDTEPYAGGKVVRFFVAEVRARTVSLPVNPALGRAEHHEYRWVTFEQGMGLLVPRLRRILTWADSVISGTAADEEPGSGTH